MINAIIIEDEKAAVDLLINALTEVDSTVRIDAVLSSVKESSAYLATAPGADLIFSDVQLPDGCSFEALKNNTRNIPVIFVTGYDEFIVNAFGCNGIEYLLKPITNQDISNALNKYRMFEKHFTEHNSKLNNLIRQVESRKKSRLIARRGVEHIALKMEDIVLLYTENKVVYIIDKEGKKYVGDKNLTEMETELDDMNFFRANRQYIINLNYIKGFKPFEKVKLSVEMLLSGRQQEVIISQENSSQFREWIYNV